jgi:hypothetical protein
LGLLFLRGDRRKSEAESEHDREPDQSHEHLGWGWLAGSLADDGHNHQEPAALLEHALFDHLVRPHEQ